MAIYTGDSLDKLRNQDLIPIVLTLQSKLEDKDNPVLEDLFYFYFIYNLFIVDKNIYIVKYQ